MRHFHLAAEGGSNPFILVLEGSVPDESNKKEGYWASFGTDASTGQPITTCEWIDRLAPKAWAVMAAGTCATYGGIHAMEGNPTGCMGLPDYLGWQWRSKGDIPIVCIPGCPVQPDNFMAVSYTHLLALANASCEDCFSSTSELRPLPWPRRGGSCSLNTSSMKRACP